MSGFLFSMGADRNDTTGSRECDTDARGWSSFNLCDEEARGPRSESQLSTGFGDGIICDRDGREKSNNGNHECNQSTVSGPTMRSDWFRVSDRVILQKGDWFRAKGGPYYVKADGSTIAMSVKGRLRFIAICTRGDQSWVEAWSDKDGSIAILPLSARVSSVPGLVPRPYSGLSPCRAGGSGRLRAGRPGRLASRGPAGRKGRQRSSQEPAPLLGGEAVGFTLGQ